MADSRLVSACILNALYLPGLEGNGPLNRRKWLAVERVLRLHSPDIAQAAPLLKQEGLWMEAGVLQHPGLLSRAESLVVEGKALTAACPLYPRRWLDMLGQGAPPALWVKGSLPNRPFFSIVGTRRPSTAAASLARRTAVLAVEKGLSICSGGAIGCDRTAANEAILASKVAGHELMVLEILPYGLAHSRPGEIPALSLCPPMQTFTSPAAMERNALIYAAAERALVAEARFREGGAWHGAVDCLRRRLSVLYTNDDGSPASKALQALGAKPANRAEDCLADSIEESLLEIL